VRDIWFDWLRQYRPDLVARYEELFKRGAYMDKDEREKLSKRARGRNRRPMRRMSVRRGEGTDPARNAPKPVVKASAQKRLF
jgi:hypothetical protein